MKIDPIIETGKASAGKTDFRTTRSLEDYYKSLLKRGEIIFDFSGRTAVPPFATFLKNKSASQPSLSGVRKISYSILRYRSNKRYAR